VKITLGELKAITDEALRKYSPDCEVDLDSFVDLDGGEKLLLLPEDEWPYCLVISS
jgi:hypothetical protein